jgi:hypothetical protein
MVAFRSDGEMEWVDLTIIVAVVNGKRSTWHSGYGLSNPGVGIAKAASHI